MDDLRNKPTYNVEECNHLGKLYSLMSNIVTQPLHETPSILYQTSDVGIPRLLLAVITEHDPPLQPDEQQITWAQTLGISGKTYDPTYNPFVLKTIFGFTLQDIIEALPSDASTLYWFALPLSFLGRELGLLYDVKYNVAHLDKLFKTVSWNLQLQPSHQSLQSKTINIVRECQYTYDSIIEPFMKDTSTNRESLEEFLWNNRRTLNRVITIVNQHSVPERNDNLMCSWFIPTDKFKILKDNPNNLRFVLSAYDIQLLRQTTHKL